MSRTGIFDLPCWARKCRMLAGVTVRAQVDSEGRKSRKKHCIFETEYSSENKIRNEVRLDQMQSIASNRRSQRFKISAGDFGQRGGSSASARPANDKQRIHCRARPCLRLNGDQGCGPRVVAFYLGSTRTQHDVAAHQIQRRE